MRNQKGFSLIEVIVAAGILAIISLGVADMMASQAKEGKAMSERLDSLSAQNLLMGLMANGAVCVYALNNSTVSTFNSSSAAAAAASVINLNTIPSSPTVGAPAAFSKSTNLNLAPTLFAKTIQVKNFVGAGTTWTADWVITLDPTKTVRSIPPITVKTALLIDNTVPSASKIVGCNTTGTTPTVPYTVWSQTWPNGGGTYAIGCHSYCSLTDTHDCSGCGFAVYKTGGVCATAGQNYWLAKHTVGNFAVTCIDF